MKHISHVIYLFLSLKDNAQFFEETVKSDINYTSNLLPMTNH